VAMGNALRQAGGGPGAEQVRADMRQALSHWLIEPSPGADLVLVIPHVQWALLAST